MNLRYAVYAATVALTISTGVARATTYNFNFAVNTSNLVNTATVNIIGTTIYTSPLTNVATGSSQSLSLNSNATSPAPDQEHG